MFTERKTYPPDGHAPIVFKIGGHGAGLTPGGCSGVGAGTAGFLKTTGGPTSSICHHETGLRGTGLLDGVISFAISSARTDDHPPSAAASIAQSGPLMEMPPDISYVLSPPNNPVGAAGRERLPGRQQPGHHAHTALCLRHPESSFEWAIKRLGQPELGRKFLNRCLGPSLCQIRYRRQSHYRAA